MPPKDRDILLYNLTPLDYPPVKLPRIEVSPSGEVRVRRNSRYLGEPLKPDYTPRGQPRVKLRGPDGLHHNVLLHRLVYFAHTFDVRVFNSNVVHVDGVTKNCHILNLRLAGEEHRDIMELLSPEAKHAMALNIFPIGTIEKVQLSPLSLEQKMDTLESMLKELL